MASEIITLKQKRFLETRTFELRDQEVLVHIKKSYEQLMWTIPLEELGTKQVYRSNPRTLNYIVMGVLAVVLLGLTIIHFFLEESPAEEGTYYVNLVLWGLLFIIFSFTGRKNEVFLTGGMQQLAFYRNVPSEEVVDAFVDALVARRRRHLKIKYTKIDKDLSEENQINQFHWLRQTNVISDEEYEALKQDLKRSKLV